MHHHNQSKNNYKILNQDWFPFQESTYAVSLAFTGAQINIQDLDLILIDINEKILQSSDINFIPRKSTLVVRIYESEEHFNNNPEKWIGTSKLTPNDFCMFIDYDEDRLREIAEEQIQFGKHQ